MHRSALFLLAALAGATGTAAAQTAGGPANASPGAMPTQTPLTSSGAVRRGCRDPRHAGGDRRQQAGPAACRPPPPRASPGQPPPQCRTTPSQ